jgi:predicted RNA-binding protein YlqC (UPF0109 family)
VERKYIMKSIADMIKNYIEDTVSMIVDRPEDVFVDTSISTKNVIVQIRVHQSDCGKIIGKKGRTIEALKIIASAIKNTNFSRDARLVIIEVLEDENDSYYGD